MKQLKFLVVALTVLMGVSLTSCMDSGNSESLYDDAGYLRTVHSYMGISYFEDLNGNRYIPTESSLAKMKTDYGFDITTADLVLIYFKYVDTTTGGDNAKSNDKYITLVSAEAIDSYDSRTVQSETDMESSVTENAPIITLNPKNNYENTYKPILYGAEMVLLPLYWRMENKAETLAQHSFNLVYVADDTHENSTELVLYLRHDKGTDTKNEVEVYRLKAFDIEDIFSQFKDVTGSYPAKMTIKAKTATDGVTLPDTYTDYEVDCSNLNK